ncbi:MAG TPA: ricin-type beta-trefoil lectin domain protein [Xanthobacteraceae bacterium]|nr:ricin-type beta-trefoil lectin domain protein [Xanthobacteraceae bacterium]
MATRPMPARPVATLATTCTLMMGLCLTVTLPAQAAEESYTFKSLLSSPTASWCIDVPGGEYQSGKHLAISQCAPKPSQIFGYESGGSVTAGGYCVSGLPATAGQPPSAGDPVGIVECDGSNQQIWQLPPFKRLQGVFAIASPDGLCVTVDGATIGEGTPLVLAQCAELDPQGWVTGKAASAAPEYYYYTGHQYCWYDGGWHGPGWYWCGENLHVGIGWGGPIGWHWWHHHGHPPHLHPHLPLHPLPLLPLHPVHPLPHLTTPHHPVVPHIKTVHPHLVVPHIKTVHHPVVPHIKTVPHVKTVPHIKAVHH